MRDPYVFTRERFCYRHSFLDGRRLAAVQQKLSSVAQVVFTRKPDTTEKKRNVIRPAVFARREAVLCKDSYQMVALLFLPSGRRFSATPLPKG